MPELQLASLEHVFYSMVEQDAASDERTLQKTIGPSSLGNPCYHCLACEISQLPKQEDPQQIWKQTVGRALHNHMERLMRESGRFIPERKVYVGDIGDCEIWGSADCFDPETGTVVDWKFVGESTLNWVRRGNLNEKYRVQPHLYGRGYERLGFDVKRTMVLFLPVSAKTVREGIPVKAAYDPAIAEEALRKAGDLYRLLYRDGWRKVIPRLKRDPRCFDCARYSI